MDQPIPETLKRDLHFYRSPLKEVASEAIEQNISKYPVFVAHQHYVSLGENILDKDELDCDWSINATIAEELIEKGVIKEDKAEEFRKIYKDPAKFICVFLIEEGSGKFIFIPREGEILGDKDETDKVTDKE